MRNARTAKCIKRFPFAAILTLFTLNTAAADTVELTNGDTLTGTIVWQTPWTVMLDHETFGRLTLPISFVEAIDDQPPRADGDASEASPTDPRDKPKSDETALEGSAPSEEEADAAGELPSLDLGPYTLFEGWERSLELGITGSEGNTQTLTFNAGFEGNFENDNKRWNIDAAYFRAQEDGNRTRDEAYLELTRDWKLPQTRFFRFATGRYDFDEFEDWDHRFSAAAGPGYAFVEKDDLNILGRVGLGGRYEIGGSDGDEFTPEALIGFKVHWDITDAQVFTAKNSLYPSLGEFGEFRNITKLGYKVKVAETQGLAVKFGIENEYQSNPDGNAKRNDLKYFATLVWDF